MLNFKSFVFQTSNLTTPVQVATQFGAVNPLITKNYKNQNQNKQTHKPIASASIGTSAGTTSIRSITIVSKLLKKSYSIFVFILTINHHYYLLGITEKFFAEFALETSIAFTNTSHANTSLFFKKKKQHHHHKKKNQKVNSQNRINKRTLTTAVGPPPQSTSSLQSVNGGGAIV